MVLAEQPTMAASINRMGRLRALSQRIVRAYCQLYLGVEAKMAEQVLVVARKLVVTGLDDLAKNLLPPDVVGQLAEVRKIYEELEAKLTSPPTRESVSAIAAQATKLLGAADRIVVLLEKRADASSGGLMNTVGSQRYLSQRLAKSYFLSAAGLGDNTLRDQMSMDKMAFVRNMATLSSSPVNTALIRTELQLGEHQWVLFNAALEREPDTRGLRSVAASSENLLEVMNNLVMHYEAVAK